MVRFPVTVFCAATPPPERAEEYLALAEDFGRMLAEAGMTCVNGGSGGMMTALSRGAAAGGRKSHGICLTQFPPEPDVHATVEHHTHLSPRQHALMLAGQAYVALPGGYGTAMEVLDVLCRKVLQEIPMERPLICVGSEHTELKRLLVGIHQRHFSSHDPYKLVNFVASTEKAMEILTAARAVQ